ncbi:hypothetical protein RF11_02627 [Thelohanellus kitauei]|uniref:Uncharacterized protein n=1 Tax=Thelohanellus kitauei TaxID=669202 RepID=A0A0C2LZQ2_THEKT|nr:hypothetical protein RF11_02627 [Thelohanellus kitauei]
MMGHTRHSPGNLSLDQKDKNHVKFLSDDEDDDDTVVVEKDSESHFTRLGFLPTDSNIRIEIPNDYNLYGNLKTQPISKSENLEIKKVFLESQSIFIEFHTPKTIGKISKIISITCDKGTTLKLKLIASCIDMNHGKPALKKGVHLLKF